MVDAIVALMLLEGVVLWGYHRLTGRGVATVALFCNLLAGVCLLLALRGALVDAAWGWIALCLALALLGHVADLCCRWKR
jgi:hypothetical protein